MIPGGRALGLEADRDPLRRLRLERRRPRRPRPTRSPRCSGRSAPWRSPPPVRVPDQLGLGLDLDPAQLPVLDPRSRPAASPGGRARGSSPSGTWRRSRSRSRLRAATYQSGIEWGQPRGPMLETTTTRSELEQLRLLLVGELDLVAARHQAPFGDGTHQRLPGALARHRLHLAGEPARLQVVVVTAPGVAGLAGEVLPAGVARDRLGRRPCASLGPRSPA